MVLEVEDMVRVVR